VSHNKLTFMKTAHLSCPFEAQLHPNKWGHCDRCPFHSTKKGHRFCSQPVLLCCFVCFLFSLFTIFLIDSSIKSVVVANWQTMLQRKNTAEFNTDKTRVLQKFFQKCTKLWCMGSF